MPTPRKLPPIWLLGFGFFPLGVFGSLMLITVPQLLAANHVPEPRIAAITAVGLIAGFLSFGLMPLLDWRFSRRTYAVVFAIIGGACLFGAFAFINHLQLLAALLFIGDLSISLCVAAVGGWFGSVTEAADDARLGAWFTAFNIGAGGAIVMVAPTIVRGLPPGVGAALLGLIVLAPLPLYFAVDCAPADDRLASESFIAFARDVLTLLRRPMVLWSILLFAAPAASFALTNTLGGYGRDFHTPEALVGWIAGAGVTVAGVVGSLVIPSISRRVAPRPLYLLVGGFGAAFTLLLMLAPRTPLTFGLALLGENVFQAASFSTQNQITLRTIGQNNPLAATQFGMLTAVSIVPLTYMQLIDGNAYTGGGVNGSLLADALVSGGACVVLGLVLWQLRRFVPPIPVAAAVELDEAA
jgi:MFS transporter, PAT family, beta-lactamase induction signal transducer AmpG